MKQLYPATALVLFHLEARYGSETWYKVAASDYIRYLAKLVSSPEDSEEYIKAYYQMSKLAEQMIFKLQCNGFSVAITEDGYCVYPSVTSNTQEVMDSIKANQFHCYD